MTQRVYDCIAGSTKKLTFVSSGAVAATISCALLSRTGTVITSAVPVSSGNGHYYAVLLHPGSRQWVVNEWRATINGDLYINRQFGRVNDPTVD